MDKYAREHLSRLETAVFGSYTMATLNKYLTEKTKLGGEPYTFRDHEVHESIARDTSREVNVQKAAQVGVSELSARMALALPNVITPFTVAYTLPTAGFAATFMRTRIDPIIDGAPDVKANIHKITDLIS